MHSPNARPAHETALRYYAQPGPMTAPGQYAACFDGLPADIPALCEVGQGLLLHVHWAARYGVTLSDDREREVNIRRVDEMLARIRALYDGSLMVARPVEQRLASNCRHFATLLCAILRHQGVSARTRCGFGAYFLPGSYEDHWVCEHWNAAE